MTEDRPDNRAQRLQALLWLGFAAACVWLLLALSPILTPFLLAAILAYIGNPASGWLARHRVPRPLAALLVILGLIGALTLLALTLVPLLQKEVSLIAERLPATLTLLQTKLDPWLQKRLGIDLPLDPASFNALVRKNQDAAQQILGHVLTTLGSSGLALVAFVANLLLLPVVMFYLLKDWDSLLHRIEDLIPRRFHNLALRLAREVDAVLAEFLRGQLAVMLLLALYYSLGLWLAGLEFALPVGLLTGLLIFIPYVGFATGLLLALVAALLQFQGLGLVLAVAIVYGGGQILESVVLTPWLVGERIGLHPVAVIFALMAFGQLFGFFGILIALPASAALLVGLRELQRHYKASPFYLNS
ncbi:AI-2E family transporter [Azospira sp. I09]|uniref:AI-2E family transporter n=1 Tax=Azospira sp. I09 TaxID=1765049 RepID=UPI001260C235|nr:AI-2E family transporter [Azospira sp. I09]